MGIGTQTVNVSGSVYRLASASAVAPSALVFTSQREGSATTQFLTLSNTAASDSFSEGLNATITASAGFTASGSFSLLAAGASSSALGVGIDTSTAGGKTGTATITLASDGSGTSGFGAFGIGTQVVNLSGGVYRLASASAVTPNPVTLSDQRVGGSFTQALTLTNTAVADGFSESLNASISASGSATASGSFALLAAGASNATALRVGVDTTTAGAKGGTAIITLASDGTGTSGLAAFGIGTQNLSVSGNVYRLAQPVVDTTPLTLVARVGDATVTRNIGISNNAPDAFTERLNASIASQPAGITAGAALVGVLPGASGNLQLSLPTTTAGTFSGNVGVALVSSSAGTTSGAADAPLAGANVALTGRVYAAAVAQVVPTVVNFGTVRVGDVLAARNVAVSNTASGALTDTLRASLAGGGAPFTTNGTVTGLAAGSSNNTALQVQLATASAGVFSSNATLALTSQNPDLADLTLAPVNVQLTGQVNNLASSALAKTGGGGTFSGAAFSYTLNFGTLVAGGTAVGTTLSLSNAASGTADALAGNWDLSALLGNNAFTVGGFGSFTGLAAGTALTNLSVTFNTGTEGSFDTVLLFRGQSTNGSGPDLTLSDVSLRLQGTVNAVPEPGSWLLMAGGLALLAGAARRRTLAPK